VALKPEVVKFHPVGPILLKYGLMVETADTSICVKFCEQMFREFNTTGGGENSAFPIDTGYRRYNSRTTVLP